MTTNRSPRSSDPRGPRKGGVPAGVPIAALLSIVGLFVIGLVTYALGTGDIPLMGSNTGNQPGQTDDPAVEKTPTPPDIVEVPSAPPTEQAQPIPGTIVYVKDGNVWLQSDRTPQQLTKGGRDSMPTFSPDGKWVYFIREREANGRWSVDGVLRDYVLDVPALMRIPVTGGKATRLYDGIVDGPGSLKWAGFLRNPAVSSDGRYIAVATDLPDPTRSDVLIKIFDTKRDRLVDPGLSQVMPLGHQDPVWRPGTHKVVYVRSDRDGAKGTPALWQYDLDTDKSKALTGPAYLHPSFSPDGKYLVATKTSAYGTDIVILNASTGAEVQRLTDDASSWAPVWSPRGDQIAYLHVSGQLVDLRLIQLEGTGPNWTAKDPIQMTQNAGLDGASHPAWFVPESDRTPPASAPDASTAP